MAVYAIGDVQGCYGQLRQLLDTLRFDPGPDRLWLTGDLVNRGPQSLETLRFVQSLGEHAVSVLGNHDLHLLAAACGRAALGRDQTLDAVLHAPDRDALLDWLRQRPLLHHDPALGFTLIHAGLPPQWDLQAACARAAEVEAVLRGPQAEDFFAHMYGDAPARWSEDLSGWPRLRFITNCFTRLRYCDAEGTLCLKAKGAPGTQPAHCQPWFAVPQRASRDVRIVFGHWSTLGLWSGAGVYGLDTGCIWGGALTALRLDVEPPRPTALPCPPLRLPAGA